MKHFLYLSCMTSCLLLFSACEIGVDPGISDEMIESILGIECKVDKDCKNEDFICVEDHCKLFCDQEVLCPTNQWCDYKTSSCITSLDGYIAKPCSDDSDCPSKTFCHLMDGGMRCTMACTSEAECTQYFSGGCCTRLEETYLCLNHASCQALDLTDGDQEIEQSTNGECTKDNYRCYDINTVQRCNMDETWVTYKYCEGKQFCYKGDCVSGDANNCKDEYECCPSTYQCKGNKFVEKCRRDGSSWEFYQECEGNDFCSGGECIDMNPNENEDGDSEEEAEGEISTSYRVCTVEVGCPNNNEYCFDPKDSETKPYCRNYCDEPGESCPSGYNCKNGRCLAIEGFCTSDSDCSSNEFCDKIPGSEAGLCNEYCFNLGQSCPIATYCDTNTNSINYGKCVSDGCINCSENYQCEGYAAEMICSISYGSSSGCCIENCNYNNEICQYGTKCCPNGDCGVYCDDDDVCTNCPSDCECDPLYGYCDCSNCPPTCEEGYYCDSTTYEQCVPEGTCINPPMCGILIKDCCPGYSCSSFVYGTYGFCI